MIHSIINLFKASTYKRLKNRYNQIAIKKRSANHVYMNNSKCRQAVDFFRQTRHRLHLNKIGFNIESRNRLNASSNMTPIAPTMNLTMGDLKYLSVNDIKALLGHEFGHFYARYHHLGHDMFSFIFSFLLILVVSIFVEQLSGTYQVVINVISIILLAIAIILICNKSFKHDEYFADDFGALLTSKHDMIIMLTKIHKYQKQKLTHVYHEMEQLKTVPLAYFECYLLYMVGLVHYLCETRGLCVHPTASQRIEHLKQLSYSNFKSTIHEKMLNQQHHTNTHKDVNYTINRHDPYIVRFIKSYKIKVNNYKKRYQKIYIIVSIIINLFLFLVMYMSILLLHYSILMNIWYFICLIVPFSYKYVRTNLLWNCLMLYKIHLIKHQSYSRTSSIYPKVATIVVMVTVLLMLCIISSIVRVAAIIFSQIGPLSTHMTKYLESL